MRDIERSVPQWFSDLAASTGAFEVLERTYQRLNGGFDCELVLQTRMSGDPIHVQVEAKSRITPREFAGIHARFKQHESVTNPILCSPRISPRVARLCRESNIGFLDAAGNCHIEAPGLFLHVEGRANPYRETRNTIDPFATKSSRVARLLLGNVKKAWLVKELAEEAAISIGLVSRVKERLLEEAFIEMRNRRIWLRDPRGLLGAWRDVYTLPKRRSLYMMDAESRAIRQIATYLGEHGGQWALAAFSGSWRSAPMVRQNMPHVYVSAHSESEWDKLIGSLGAKPVESGANLSLWLPADDFVFHQARMIEETPVVSAIQLYLDLSKLSGRGEEAALEVFEKEIEPQWQT